MFRFNKNTGNRKFIKNRAISQIRLDLKPLIPRLNKAPAELEDYFKILERTMDHPTVKPQFRYSTYLDHYAAFSNFPMRPYNGLRSCAALSSATRPKMAVDTSFPSTSAKIVAALESDDETKTHLTKSCHLIGCTKASDYILKYLQVIQQTLKKCSSRAKKFKFGTQGHTTHASGLAQFGGFCREISAITSVALLGTRNFAITSGAGFNLALDMLRDTNTFVNESRNSHVKFPSEESSANSRIKIQVSLDLVLQSYEKIGRPGFSGNWTVFEHCDLEVISGNEMETMLIALMNAFVCLSSMTADLLEVFRALIYADNVEKTYLLNHIRNFPSNDQAKVLNSIQLLMEKIRKIHELLQLVNISSQKVMKKYCLAPLPNSNPNSRKKFIHTLTAPPRTA